MTLTLKWLWATVSIFYHWRIESLHSNDHFFGNINKRWEFSSENKWMNEMKKKEKKEKKKFELNRNQVLWIGNNAKLKRKKSTMNRLFSYCFRLKRQIVTRRRDNNLRDYHRSFLYFPCVFVCVRLCYKIIAR